MSGNENRLKLKEYRTEWLMITADSVRVTAAEGDGVVCSVKNPSWIDVVAEISYQDDDFIDAFIEELRGRRR